MVTAAENARQDSLPSVYDVSGFAVSALTDLASAVARLHGQKHGTELGDRQARQARQARGFTVDRRLASLWMTTTAFPVGGWKPASAWDDLAGDYQAADGWIRLHTNARLHRQAALNVLECEATKTSVARHILTCNADELETAIHFAGGVAARMRTAKEWIEHPQGAAVRQEELVEATKTSWSACRETQSNSTVRPLSGVRVLDLTKVLAGPVATRFLALLGADVIRVDSRNWAEAGVSHDTTVGKRCVHIDGKAPQGQVMLQTLYRTADILVHGYRPGVLESLGLSDAVREALNPGIVEVSLNAYGHTGPWRSRRAFDSVVQMSCGIAHEGMVQFGKDRPTPLPVQALDHITGYLMAAAAVTGWTDKLETGYGSQHRLSLARTAVELMSRTGNKEGTIAAVDESDSSTDLLPNHEDSSWGRLRRLRPPFSVPGVELKWDFPATELGSHPVPIDWTT